jgi:hypothetical protein
MIVLDQLERAIEVILGTLADALAWIVIRFMMQWEYIIYMIPLFMAGLMFFFIVVLWREDNRRRREDVRRNRRRLFHPSR